MLSDTDLDLIVSCAKKYHIAEIYLFGSSLDDSVQPRDIDLGIKGIRPEHFFKFYGELLGNLSKDVDLVDLSQKTLFNELVEKRGVKIYG